MHISCLPQILTLLSVHIFSEFSSYHPRLVNAAEEKCHSLGLKNSVELLAELSIFCMNFPVALQAIHHNPMPSTNMTASPLLKDNLVLTSQRNWKQLSINSPIFGPPGLHRNKVIFTSLFGLFLDPDMALASLSALGSLSSSRP